MSGLLVPDDWNEGQDGFCKLTFTVPNSPYWRANVKGQISYLAKVWQWDAQTGDADQAAVIGQDIFDSNQSECGLLSNQIAYFPLSDLLDHIGDNDLINVGGVSFVPGIVDNAAQFDGSNYLERDSLGALGSFSVSCWINDVFSAVFRVICGEYDFDNKRRWRLYRTETNSIVFVVSPNGTFSNAYSLETGSTYNSEEWHHVAAVFDADEQELRLYVNGQPDGVKSVTFSSVFSTLVNFQVGTSWDSGTRQEYTGLIDELRVFHKALTQDEVTMLFEA